MPEPTPLLSTDPQAIGLHQLGGRLGVGGQGTVYLGQDERGQRAAIKLLHPHLITHETARTRFLAEVEIAKRVAPFCTAQVLDSGVVNDQPYIVSEFVDGPSLLTSVKDGGPRREAALDRLAINTITALAAIHKGGVVHRDFKPGNVLLGPDGPVVIDFGISRALDLSQSLTSSQAIGTPGYMAPEHIDGEKAGPEADLFAWAATMVFAATGQRAFPGTNVSAVALAVLHKEAELHGLEGDLAEIVRACLRKDPAERPTAAEVGDHLRDLHPPEPPPDDNPADEPPPDKPPPDAPLPDAPLPDAPPPDAPPPDAPPPDDTPSEDTPSDETPSDETPADKIPADDTPLDAPPPHSTKRRRLVVVAAAVTVLVLVGTLYEAFPGREKGSASPPTPDPSGTVSQTSTTSPSEKPSKSPDPTTSKTSGSPKPDPRPTVTKGQSPSGRPPPKKPPNSKPRTLGTLTTQDYESYCKSHGYPYYVVFADQGVCSKDPEGNNGTIVSPTTVCRWKHSDKPNVSANGRTCVSNP